MQKIARSALFIPPSITSAPSTLSHFPRFARSQSTSTPSDASQKPSLSQNTRWLSDARARIGRCIQFGLSKEQVKEAGSLLQEMETHWRELVAGSEGFLATKDHAGLYRQEVVWGEMDSMCAVRMANVYKGHVNNVVYNRYAESARVNWILKFAAADPTHKEEWLELVTPKRKGLILRSIRTDYKFPMAYPDRVTVLHKLKREPEADNDQFDLDVLILSERHRRIAARCREALVVYDYRARQKSAMQPFMVDMLQQFFYLQEQAREANEERVKRLLEQVQSLEKRSWDRPDAKEDIGGAATDLS